MTSNGYAIYGCISTGIRKYFHAEDLTMDLNDIMHKIPESAGRPYFNHCYSERWGEEAIVVADRYIDEDTALREFEKWADQMLKQHPAVALTLGEAV